MKMQEQLAQEVEEALAPQGHYYKRELGANLWPDLRSDLRLRNDLVMTACGLVRPRTDTNLLMVFVTCESCLYG